MQLETILRILYANNLEHIVSHAIRIDNNISLPLEVNDSINVSISKSNLPSGFKFANNEHWGVITLNIVGVNEYAIDKPYLVQMPNGKLDWVGKDDRANSVTAIVPIDTP